MLFLSTLLLLTGSNFGLSAAFVSYEEKIPSNGLDVGKLGPLEICSDSKFVTSFQVKSDGAQSGFYINGLKDGLGVTGVQFMCQSKFSITNITSAVGSKGDWYDVQSCPRRGRMIGLQLLVKSGYEFFPKFNDKLGVEDVRIYCEDGTTLNGLGNDTNDEEQEELEGIVGNDPSNWKHHRGIKMPFQKPDWGKIILCSPGYYICGLQSQIDSSNILMDNTGMTNLRYLCCQ